ncbi:MAG TPA: glycosyltransferase [Acidobacteriaceae bacterium]
MRVLLTIHHPLTPDQGAPGVTYQLWKHFEARGDQAKVLSFTDMADARALRSPLLRQVRFPWFVSRELHRLETEFDVADCSSGDGWVYQARRRKSRLLTVARSHGLEHLVDAMFREQCRQGQTMSWKYPLYHGGYRLWEVAKSFRTADVAIFPNHADRDYAIENLRVRPERAVILPNGIPDVFLGLPRQNHREDGAGLRVAVVGSYGHRKINVAPQALNRAMRTHPDLMVGFLGTGISEVNVLQDYEPEHHPRIRVVPHYAHAELPSLLKDYDVLLFPSLSEGFGLVVYEAMACGLAVIATRLDALQTYLRDGHDVLFIQPGSPEAIEAALHRMATTPAFRMRLQDNGRQTAQRFAWSRIVDETAAIYAEYIARKRARQPGTVGLSVASQADSSLAKTLPLCGTISVVIPTYKRPDSLQQCLQGLRVQQRPADEVLVIIQAGDEETLEMLARWTDWPALKVLQVTGGGAVAQYNRGLDAGEGNIVAITDDDSIPRPDWLVRIEKRFAEDENLGGVGGRDIVHQGGSILNGDAKLVGIVQWFGRIIHNHHVGSRFAAEIDILKGVNMSFRAAALQGLRFDTGLRGKGAQVCLDMAISFAVRKRNWRMLYDPDIVVDHFPATRFDPDQRDAPSMEAVEESSYNFYLTLRRYLHKGFRRGNALRWARWIGTARSPGILRGLFSRLKGDREGMEMRAAAQRAWLDAKRDCG